MKKLLLMLFVACATPEGGALYECQSKLASVRCPTCRETTLCDECLRVCGDAGVRRCEVGGSRSCECKGF